jgi:hypothetical protein
MDEPAPDMDQLARLGALGARLDGEVTTSKDPFVGARPYINPDTLVMHAHHRAAVYATRAPGFSARERETITKLIAAAHMDGFILGARWNDPDR